MSKTTDRAKAIMFKDAIAGETGQDVVLSTTDILRCAVLEDGQSADTMPTNLDGLALLAEDRLRKRRAVQTANADEILRLRAELNRSDRRRDDALSRARYLTSALGELADKFLPPCSARLLKEGAAHYPSE